MRHVHPLRALNPAAAGPFRAMIGPKSVELPRNPFGHDGMTNLAPVDVGIDVVQSPF